MKFLYLPLIILLFSVKTKSQISYAFSALPGTYVPITGGTSPVLSPSELLSTHDEGYANGIPIGFPFNYNGTIYTTINANSNGFAAFNPFVPVTNSATQDYYTADLAFGPFGLTSVRPLLAPLWDDLDLFAAGDLKYVTTGVAPNRIFIIQWSNVYWDVSATNLNIEFQLILYETRNVIEFQYHQLPGALSASVTAAIGITAAGTGNGNYLSLNNASTSPVASSTVNTFSINTKPAEGQIYRFTPNANAPVPILLESFIGERKDNLHLMHWVTSFEQNNKGFDLQRSGDGLNFTKIAFIASKAPGGNSSLALQYSFDDKRPIAGDNFYRLMQIDFNNKITYSNIVSLHALSIPAFRIIGVYPNPVINSLNVLMYVPTKTTAALLIVDVAGQVVIQKTIQAVAGDNNLIVDVTRIGKGTYTLKLITLNGEILTTQFIK